MAENLGNSHPAMQQLSVDIAMLESRLTENQDNIESPQNELRVHPQELLHAYRCLLMNDLANVTQHITFLKKSLASEESAAKSCWM